MNGPTTAYLVASGAMLFCALSALTLIYVVAHLDPPETRSSPEHGHTVAAV